MDLQLIGDGLSNGALFEHQLGDGVRCFCLEEEEGKYAAFPVGRGDLEGAT